MVSHNSEHVPDSKNALPEISFSGNAAITWPPSDGLNDEGVGPGSRIGEYRLIDRIGHGGMGVVYKAEQLYPLKRIVALKLIRRGMETGDVVARFNLERQSLAKLDHPGIARVFDAGSSESGRPFFAMEFVPGAPITQVSDDCRLTIRQRLELLIDVCDAVQHAHFRGIIHRDLKPGNILVISPQTAGARSSARVIDFGIAKAVNPHADVSPSDSAFQETSIRTLIGTPEYMSPEQAIGGDIDTRTDVYSLGVILYELLTGALPFDRRKRDPVVRDSARSSSNYEAVRPSKRLSQLDAPARAAAAEVRGIEPGGLHRMLRGDLDWIVLRAMDEDRRRRYATPAELAEDLNRFLAEEPVVARPATRGYVARKFVRRHKVAVFATGAVLVALLLGSVGTAVGLARSRAGWAAAANEARSARDAHNVAEVHRRDAERALAEVYPGTGLAAAARGDWTEAALWFAQAARLSGADPSNDRGAVELNRVRVAAALQNAIRPVAAFSVGDRQTSSLSFDPTGKYLLVQSWASQVPERASSDGSSITCTFWELATQRPIQNSSIGDVVTGAAWSADGKRVAISTLNNRGVRVCRFPQFDQPVEMKDAGRAEEMKFDPSGSLLLARARRMVRVWRAETGVPVTPSLKHPKDVIAAGFTTDGKGFMTACADDQARMFTLDSSGAGVSSLNSAITVPHLSGPTSPGVEPLAAPISLADTDLFLTIDPSGLRARRASTGEVVTNLRLDGPVQWVAADPTGTRIAAGVAGRLMIARRVDDLLFWEDAPGVRPSNTTKGRFSPDGKFLLTTSDTGEMDVCSVDGAPRGSAMASFHAKSVAAAAWSADGSRFATVQEGGLVRVWSMNDPAPFQVAAIPIHGSRSAARFSSDGRFIVPSGEVSAEARELHADLYATRVYSSDGIPAGPTLDPNGIIVAARFSSDGNRVVAAVRGESGNRMHIWDWRTGKPAAPLALPSDPRSLAIRPGPGAKSYAAILCVDGEIVLADLDTGKIDRQFRVTPTGRARGTAVGQIQISPDGRSIATWGDGDTLQVSDWESGPKFNVIHSGGVRDARFSTDGAKLITLGANGSARLTDTRTGTLLSKTTGGSPQPSSSTARGRTSVSAALVRISPDGQSICIVSDAEILLLGQLGGAITPPRRLSHPQPVAATEFSPDNRWILTACNDGFVRLWERSSGQLAAITHAPLAEAPSFIDISVDGRRAVISGQGTAAEILALDGMVLPPPPLSDRTADMLCNAAELFSGRVMQGGSLVPLNADQWLNRWTAPHENWAGDDRSWHRQHASALITSGEYRAARIHLWSVINSDDSASQRDAGDGELAAVALAGMKDFSAAASAFEAALKRRPDDRELLLDQGDMLLAQSRSDDAAAVFERAMGMGSALQCGKKNWIRGSWWVSHAYPPGLDQSFPPETPDGAVNGSSSATNNASLWAFSGRKGPWVDFNALLHIPREHRTIPKTAYAQTFIYARNPQKVALSIGTDDLGRLWLNDEVVYNYSGKARGAFRGQGRLVLSLRPGWNTLRAKVVDLGRTAHELFASLSDEENDLRLAEAQGIADRADAAGARGDHADAIAGLTRAIELFPQDTQWWQQLAVLKLNAGDLDGWRRLCGQVVERFGDSADRNTAERVAKICSLANAGGIDAATLRRAADRAVAGGPDPYFEWFELARGMVEYRVGDNETAAIWLDRSRATAKAAGACRATATSFLAMAEYRRKHFQDAQRLLDEGRQLIENLESQAIDRPSAEWNDRLAAKIVQAEADRVVSGAVNEPQR